MARTAHTAIAVLVTEPVRTRNPDKGGDHWTLPFLRANKAESCRKLMIEEDKYMRSVQLLILSVFVVSSPAWSGSKSAPARYPSQLHGYWIPEEASCPRAGESFDGDTVMRIGPRMIQDYGANQHRSF